MSSHHIIRENQEAAIFLVDKSAIVKGVLESFFEWNPLILATEECFILINRWGFKADAIICEKGFIENFETELAMQQPIDIINAPKNTDVIKAGLDYFSSRRCPAVNIFSMDAGLWKNSAVAELKDLNVNIVQGNQRGFLIHSGAYEKWLPAHSQIRITPAPTGQLFMFKNQNGPFQSQKADAELVVNIDKDGIFSVSSRQGFQIWEPI